MAEENEQCRSKILSANSCPAHSILHHLIYLGIREVSYYRQTTDLTTITDTDIAQYSLLCSIQLDSHRRNSAVLIHIMVKSLLFADIRNSLLLALQNSVHERRFLTQSQWWERIVQAPEDEEADRQTDDEGEVVQPYPAGEAGVSDVVDRADETS
jgi:hypothetical protein